MTLYIEVLDVEYHLGHSWKQLAFMVAACGLDAPALESGKHKVKSSVTHVLAKPHHNVFEVQIELVVFEVVKLKVVVDQTKQSSEVPLLYGLELQLKLKQMRNKFL